MPNKIYIQIFVSVLHLQTTSLPFFLSTCMASAWLDLDLGALRCRRVGAHLIDRQHMPEEDDEFLAPNFGGERFIHSTWFTCIYIYSYSYIFEYMYISININIYVYKFPDKAIYFSLLFWHTRHFVTSCRKTGRQMHRFWLVSMMPKCHWGLTLKILWIGSMSAGSGHPKGQKITRVWRMQRDTGYTGGFTGILSMWISGSRQKGG